LRKNIPIRAVLYQKPTKFALLSVGPRPFRGEGKPQPMLKTKCLGQQHRSEERATVDETPPHFRVVAMAKVSELSPMKSSKAFFSTEMLADALGRHISDAKRSPPQF